MNPEQWQRVKQIINEALELSAAQRQEHIQRCCAGEAELLQAVESLLVLEDSVDDFLKAPSGYAASSMLLNMMLIPEDCKPVMALSRPDPGPLTLISISFTPNLEARSAHVSAARCAAKGVLLRLPLKPDVPAVAQQRTSPLRSVMVTEVLLKVALMCATARVTFRRTLRRLDFAMRKFSLSGSS